VPIELSPGSRAVTLAALREAGCVFAEDELAVLAEAAGDAAELAALVRRRARGEPLEQVVGRADFCGVRVALSPGVFVPRFRTRLLVREAAAAAAPGALVVDLCCGSGALGLAVARRVPGVELHASDVEPRAVACARANLAGVGRVYQGDLFAALPAVLRGRVAVLLANVPYVPTAHLPLMPAEARLHEPAVALDGGVDGLAVFRRVVAGAGDWLAPGGVVLSECAEGQVDAALAALRGAGLAARAVTDDDLEATAVAGRRAGTCGPERTARHA
jgi:release factor glutamine methyltransferase